MKNKLNYFITRSSFLGVGYYLLYKYSEHDAWIAIILGTILGIGIIYLFSLIQKYCNKDNLIYKILYTIINLYFILVFLNLLPLFVNSFYLVNTPSLFITLPFLILCIYLSLKGRNVLYYCSNILFILSILFIFLEFLALIKNIELNLFLPVLEISNKNLLKSTLFYSAMTAIPNIITINHNFEFKKMVKSYLFSSFILLCVAILTIGTIGSSLLSSYSFPEYVVLKRISILNFIENIENILSIIWYCDLFILISTCCENVKYLIKTKYMHLGLISIPFLLTILFFNTNYIRTLVLFDIYPYCLSIILIVFIMFNLFNIKKKR